MKHIHTFESFLNESLNEGQSTENAKTIMSNLKKEKDGIYVLKGGLEKGGGWNPDSLQKGKPLYYTTDFDDPKLKSFQEDGMVWVDIERGEMEVNEY
jgi:hypothetical protein